MKEKKKQRTLCRCEQDRKDCKAYIESLSEKSGGVCRALTDTHFDYACPFYKSRKEPRV